MDREYASPSAMGYAQQQQQQQQQFGGYPPPQHQQFPPSVHRPPFIPPHPPLQQFPYHQQFPPHQPPPHHPHIGHLQQPPPNFPPHLPPHLVPSPFRGPFDSSPPPPAPPPSDPELQKRIDKLVEYSAKNGPEFEAMIREKQQDNPAYSFLFGGEGHSYYRYKLFISTRPPGGPFNPMFPGASPPLMHPPPNPMMNAPPATGASGPMMGGPQMLQHPFPPFYDHQQPFPSHGRPEYDQSPSKPFKSMSGSLPPDVATELNNVLNSLSGTKESIKGAKTWFMQRSNFAPALAESLRDRVYAVDDCERQLHVVYLVNDILFDSLQRRINPHELDNEALAFRPILGSILARVYHNPQEKEENQSRLQKILQFWASKEVYDQNTIYALEGEMLGGPPPNAFAGTAKDLTDPSMVSGQQTQQTTNANILQWQQDKQGLPNHQLPDKQGPMVPSMPQQPLVNQQFLPGSHPSSSVLGSMHTPSTISLANQQPPAYMLPTPPASSIGEKVPPYPLFPPGLIPGMVRKMQIGSGVPYSPMSPLDIPTVIPPSSISPTETLERVSKFFKEIGEVNPSEGPMGSKDAEDDDYEYKRDSPVRKGGACIPPPMNLQVDPETGTYPDGTVETKPGSSSSGRLGLGATANPNEVSQYDDVYTSYRKQRSTNYHSSMSLRAATR